MIFEYGKGEFTVASMLLLSVEPERNCAVFRVSIINPELPGGFQNEKVKLHPGCSFAATWNVSFVYGHGREQSVTIPICVVLLAGVVDNGAVLQVTGAGWDGAKPAILEPGQMIYWRGDQVVEHWIELGAST